MAKINDFLKNLLIIFCSVIIMLIILEIGFRIFYSEGKYKNTSIENERVFQKSEYLPWVLKPNSRDAKISPYGDYNVTLEINSYGIRDYEMLISDKSKKILVLGDSMTYGQGVEMNETYPKYLERMLNKREDYQVFNGGYAASHSIDSYYLYLKKEGLQKFKPSIVVIGFFVYDDITDVSLNNWVERKNGLPEKIESKVYDIEDSRLVRKRGIIFKYPELRKLYGYLLYKSRFFNYVKNTISDIILTSSSNRIFDKQLNNDIFGQFETDKKILIATNEFLKKNNAELIILVLPVKFQIYDDAWEEYSAKIGKDALSRTKPDDLIKEFGAENKIKVVDLYEVFHEKNKKTPLFLKVDGHLNSEGHKITAEEIYKSIKKSGASDGKN